MSSLRQSPLPTLSALSGAFTELNSTLAPLLAQNYEALNAALQANSAAKDGEDELHGRLDAARMQVSVAYVLMDLVWILLKVKGVDPTGHPVMMELERVKGYFGKIKGVQEGQKEDSKTRVDKSAAGRFIRAALAGDGSPAGGKHTKFDEETPKKAAAKETEAKAATEEKSPEKATATPTSANKKKRPAMDPFEGYDKPKTPKTAPATPTAAKQTDSASSSPTKKQKKNKKASASK
ncbi:Sas10/Utp3/C1D [Kalmanozyma brasiliensis GHG001]|uniref:Exosome complex protein n=1 Tax=Kalmanozyma brasiliensis (strain GHG001) TaxID=1365824 RepID=V5GKM0_KALBG|nr:Sas10/Utp3/C1D [Kalmanozyma brasiliensis GHG001]EST06507.1 Sas10/Utp3/C1D [Kalmanozyma brasiliensis GHG001]